MVELHSSQFRKIHFCNAPDENDYKRTVKDCRASYKGRDTICKYNMIPKNFSLHPMEVYISCTFSYHFSNRDSQFIGKREHLHTRTETKNGK
jgi:hypothetical protein